MYLCHSMNLKHLRYLLYKEILLEYRQKYAISGIVLYVFVTLFILQKSLGLLNLDVFRGSSMAAMKDDIYIALYWIVVLFTSVNAAAKSFIHEGRSRQLYYYTLSSPHSILMAKFIYNALLLLILAFISYWGFLLLFGDFTTGHNYFIIAIILGATGFAATFTTISAIASRAEGNAALMTILSFPIIIPQLLLLSVLSFLKNAAMDFPDNFLQNMPVGIKDSIALLALNVIVIFASYLLFPYLWRE